MVLYPKKINVVKINELVKSLNCHPELVEGDITSCFDELTMTDYIKFDFL
jgi:hypothetical protein